MLDSFSYLHVLSVRFLIYVLFRPIALVFLLLLVHLHLVLYKPHQKKERKRTISYMNNEVMQLLQR